MASKDVTRLFGSIRFVLPLILIFFIAAGSAIACPKHTSKAAYRTKAINTRTVSYMTPVVITYGGQRCVDNGYGTRRVKYVSMRDNGYYEGGAQYVAVRRSVPRTRYVAVRDHDLDYAPRYVSVRRQPVYVDSGMRYVAVRNYVPRQRVVAVHHKAIGDVSYVATQRVPYVDDYFDRVRPTKVVAVSSYAPRTRYVTVRDPETGCTRVVRRCLDDVETTSMRRVVYRNGYSNGMRHVVVKSDYIAGTEEVIVPKPSFDDTAFVDLPRETVVATDVAYTDVGGDAYITTSNVADPCVRRVAVRTCGDAVSTRTVSYLPEHDVVDFDDQAVLYDDVTYVAADDMEYSCLPRAVVHTSPAIERSEAVSYVPMDHVDDVSYMEDDAASVVAVDAADPPIRYVSSIEDEALVDMDATCLRPVAVRTCDEVDADPVSFVTVNDVDFDGAAVSYVPVESVSYVPVENVSYVPVETVDGDCVTTVVGEPVSFADDPEILVDEDGISTVAEIDSGLVDGADTVLDHDVDYSDSGGQIMAAEGYDDTIAEVDVEGSVFEDPNLDEHNAEIHSDVGSA